MGRVFLTKVWGFTPDVYPALGFNTEGARRKFIRESSPGDWVVLAGTKGKETNPEDRGRLLGMIQLGAQEVDVEAVLKSIGTPIPPEHYLEDGSYRWPYGLPMLTARRFVGAPDLSETLGSYLRGMVWAAYAQDVSVKVAPDAPQTLMALPWAEVSIIEAPEIRRQRGVQDALQLNRKQGATGPGPSTERGGSSRSAGMAAAYVFKLQGGRRPAFKVGYSGDVDQRLSDLNKGLVTAVTGCSWSLVTQQHFADEQIAYRFEQAMHARLRRHLVDGETEIYTVRRGELDTVWAEVLFSGSWALAEGTG